MIVSEKGLKYKDIADEMNISPEWLSRLMRNTLTTDNKVRIMGAIEKLTKGVESDDIQ
jgi:orotate phosphoribosyltransferase-like protein